MNETIRNVITSRTNQKLKNVKKLLCSAKERKNTGLFVIEGERLCREAPAHLIESVYVSEDLYRSDRFCADAWNGFREFFIVENGVFRDLSDTVNPQGILAVVRQPVWEEKYLTGIINKDEQPGRILLLDGIRDPGNLGTILRTAEAAGVRVVYMSPDCVDLYNPKVIRSTMGSIFRVRAVTADLMEIICRLKEARFSVYGTSLGAEKSYRDVDLENAAVIIGSEANGAREEILQAATQCIRIPMCGQVESLNAAVSAAILMFC